MTLPTTSDVSRRTARLTALMRHPTRYEVTATHPDGTICLVGYTPRRGGSGLLALARTHGAALIAWLGVTDDTPFAWGPRRQSLTLGAARLAFSGRTEREAILAGELPRIPPGPITPTEE